MNSDEADKELCLYFALKENENVDLEIIAQSAIDFCCLARSVTQAIDPLHKSKIELVNATQGSIFLNAIMEIESGIGYIKDALAPYPNISDLLKIFAIPVATGVTIEEIMRFFPHKAKLKDPEETERQNYTIRLLEKIEDNTSVISARKKFYKTIEQDPSITGIGVSKKHNTRPTYIIPNTRFAGLSGLWDPEEQAKQREINQEIEVILISPVLITKPKNWKFKIPGLTEFSAKMDDKEFLKALDQDHIQERLRTGITMNIQLQTLEEFIDDEWKAKKRTVIKVLSPAIL